MKKEKIKSKPPKDQRKQYKPPNKQVSQFNFSDFFGLAIIILLGILIYSNSFSCTFHLDDLNSIINNTKIRSLTEVKALWDNGPMRFIAYYTFALNYHFGALNVWGYHLVNLSIHLLSACLIYWLTLLIFSSPVLRNNPIIRHKKLIALFTALLFVSHPLATQSVTYIVQRMSSLAAMFYLLSVALYVKARLLDKSNIPAFLLFTGSVLAAVLAMLTKENAFSLPVAIVLFEIFFLQTKKLTLNFKDYRMIMLAGAFLSIFLFIYFKFSLSIFNPIPPSPSLGISYTVTPLNYLSTQFSVIVKYIQLLFLPVHQNLDYDYAISNHFFEIRTVLSFMMLLFLIVLAIFLFKKNRVISFGIFWFFLTLSIESGIVPISDLIFEHRTYLPSFGFFLMLTTGIFGLHWDKNKYLVIAVFLVLAGTYSFLAYERNKVWKDDLTLWNDVVLKSPHKARPVATRGDCYRNLGQLDKAIADYSTAIQISPEYTTAYHDRAGVYGRLGQWDKAIADYSNAIRIDPGYKLALYNRGNAYGTLGQWDKAIPDYSAAVGVDPEFTFAFYARSIAYGHLKQWEKAITDCNNAIGTDPKYAPAYANRGISYYNLGQLDKAIADYGTAIEMDPKISGVYTNRGVAYDNLKQWDKAIADYSMAINMDPKDANTYYNRGVAYGNLRQWDKAIADYSKAIELDPKYANAYTNRDIAYSKLHNPKIK